MANGEDWIGHHTVLTNEDGVYDDVGVKYLDLLSLDEDLIVDESEHPILAGLASTIYTGAEEQAVVTPPNTTYASSTICEDILILGSNAAGAIYIYRINRTDYSTELLNTVTVSAGFGVDVSMYGDIVIVGNHTYNSNKGIAYIYRIDTTTGNMELLFTVQPEVPTTNANFGVSVSVYDGYFAVGAYNNAGYYGTASVYSLDADNSTYALLFTFSPSDGETYDNFGIGISLYENYLAVGSSARDVNGVSQAGSVRVYLVNFAESTYELLSEISAETPLVSGGFGRGVALCHKGVVIGEDNNSTIGSAAGAAHLYSTSGYTKFSYISEITSSTFAVNARYGTNISIDGEALTISPLYGAAYVFSLTQGKGIYAVTSPTDDMPWKIVADLTED